MAERRAIGTIDERGVMKLKNYILIPENMFEITRKLLNNDKYSDQITMLWLHIYTDCNQRTKDGWPSFSVHGVEMTNANIQILFRMQEFPFLCDHAMGMLEDAGMLKRCRKSIVIIPPWIKKRDRNTPEYKEWRFNVMKRDGFRCVTCGSANNLVAHHVVKWSDTAIGDPLRFDVKNGITLCHDCHLKEHGGRWR